MVRASRNTIKRDRASKWLSGSEAPSYRLAVATANALGVNPVEALQAAGFDVVEAPAGVESTSRVSTLVRALDDIERQMPRELLIERLKRFTERELLSELQRRVAVGPNVTGSVDTESLQDVDLSEDYDLAASEDDSSVDPSRGEA